MTRQKIDWRRLPSVRAGGKPYFWVTSSAYTAAGTIGHKYTVMWDRNRGVWGIWVDDSGEPLRETFKTAEAAKREIERWLISNPQRPPADWFYAMKRKIMSQKKYHKKTDADLNAITAGVWWKLPIGTRRRIIGEREGENNPEQMCSVTANPGKSWHLQQMSIAAARKFTSRSSADRTYYRGMYDAQEQAALASGAKSVERTHALLTANPETNPALLPLLSESILTGAGIGVGYSAVSAVGSRIKERSGRKGGKDNKGLLLMLGAAVVLAAVAYKRISQEG